MISHRTVAKGLAWFGIALGAAELVAPRKVALASGLQGREGVIRLFGAREVASGVAVLAASTPETWLWTRVAGDGLDSALLASRMTARNPYCMRTVVAALTVLPVVCLDLSYSRRIARR